jgi:hypothetical protein
MHLPQWFGGFEGIGIPCNHSQKAYYEHYSGYPTFSIAQGAEKPPEGTLLWGSIDGKANTKSAAFVSFGLRYANAPMMIQFNNSPGKG